MINCLGIVLLYFVVNLILTVLMWRVPGKVPSKPRYFVAMILFGVPLMFLLVVIGSGVMLAKIRKSG